MRSVVPLAIAVVFGLVACDQSSGGGGVGQSASSTSIPTTNPATTSSALLPYGSRDLSYKLVRQGKAEGFEQPTFDDSGWAVGDAPFATHASSCGIFLTGKTEWQGNHTDLLLRIHFDVHSAPADLEVGIAVDNDIQAFVNGVDVSHGVLEHDYCPTRDWAVIEVPADVLVEGDNLLALRAHNDTGPAFLDFEIR